ncbi:TPA: DUF551 domain-containing protein [Klebsiella pneumoniae]|nr:DUF551 domain-containing protein [Klebsiella pneumoniae]
MDGELVAYISKSDFDAGYPHILARRDFNKACTMAVYAAQPAPVVPDELLKEYLRLVQCMLSDYRDGNYGNAQRWIRHIAKASDDFERKHGISPWEMARKTCRAAMLAAAPQSPGSEPATVPGTWIPVSERMPEDEQEVLTINRMGHRFVSFFDKHSGLYFDRLDAPAACCIEHVLVTHWMPLPAAPQEVKGE